MPIRSALNRGGRREHAEKRHTPKLPPIPQPMHPEEAIPASLQAAAAASNYLTQLLKGPMAGSPQFLRQYAINAQMLMHDLVKQLSNKLTGTPSLDGVVSASVDLLSVASEHDPEAAAELAKLMDDYVARNGHALDAHTERVLASADTLEVESTEAEVRFDNGELWAAVACKAHLNTPDGAVVAHITGVMPVANMTVILEPEA